jgi:hypothetical protein
MAYIPDVPLLEKLRYMERGADNMGHPFFRGEWASVVGEAAREIGRLRAALVQFVAACDTAPPTSLMIEIGMACDVARAALSDSSHVGKTQP